ncbi:hypothetical protein QBC35DRAFT_495618 [Podospora australis]|uniref:Uncharacterized protein n=1 Tax=Podospora australis TaxID=1536484 RepID=A0AAN6WUW7_9PEZI|nr:hypothetical protein QBC35DRAFT_495618 [Podospora australis]
MEYQEHYSPLDDEDYLTGTGLDQYNDDDLFGDSEVPVPAPAEKKPSFQLTFPQAPAASSNPSADNSAETNVMDPSITAELADFFLQTLPQQQTINPLDITFQDVWPPLAGPASVRIPQPVNGASLGPTPAHSGSATPFDPMLFNGNGQQNQLPNNALLVREPNYYYHLTPAQTPGPAAAAGQPFRPPIPLDGKKIAHNRKDKYRNNDPREVYGKPVGLQPWGPLSQASSKMPRHLFEYTNSTAELAPYRNFSKEELITFMLGKNHPLPNRKLTLWIQTCPAQTNDRYVLAASSGKCRYKHCPGAAKSIMKGFFRVAFDEFSDLTGTVLDPFHNAGYMHLHCFEMLFDLGYLLHYGAAAHGFAIKPEWRFFPYETRNPMSLTRDRQEMADAFHHWVQQQKPRCDELQMQNNQARETGGAQGRYYDGFYPDHIPPHKARLGCRLTTQHLSTQLKGRYTDREKRGGAHIGLHKGDLELYMYLKKGGTMSQRKSRLGSNGSKGSSSKRRRDEDDDEDYQPPSAKRVRQLSGASSGVAAAPQQQKRPKRLSRINTSFSGSSAQLHEFMNPEGYDFYQYLPQEGGVTSSPSSVLTPVSPVARPLPLGPRTRQRSKELSGELVSFLNSRRGSILTRGLAHEIQTRLDEEPSYVQQEVLSAVSPAVASLLAKVDKLNKRQQREVEGVVEKKIATPDGRKFQSM